MVGSATYDFLLVIHSNYKYGPIPCPFWGKRRFWSKNANLPYRLYLTPPLTVLSEFCNAIWLKNCWLYQVVIKSDNTDNRFDAIGYQTLTDRVTDRRT